MPRRYHKPWDAYVEQLAPVTYFRSRIDEVGLENAEPYLVPCEGLTRAQIHSQVVQYRTYFTIHLPRAYEEACALDPKPAGIDYLKKLRDTAPYLAVNYRASDNCIVIQVKPVILNAHRYQLIHAPDLSLSRSTSNADTVLDLEDLAEGLRKLGVNK